MTEHELNELLTTEGLDGELQQVLDIKTLVLDTVKRMEFDELLTIFWQKLPDMTEAQIRDYFYMRRG